jgi:Domain of unknown function (DUF1906)
MRLCTLFAVIALTGALLGHPARAQDTLTPTPPNGHPKCKPHDNLTVADVSFPIHKLTTRKGNKTVSVLEVLRDDFKIKTIFRYYDHIHESIENKTLQSAEVDAIIAAGLSIGVVFQHNNDDPTKFLEARVGVTDAKRALDLADKFRQPFDTAIYFGIDGPERHLEPLKKEFVASVGKPISSDRKKKLKSEFVENRLKELKEKYKSDGKPSDWIEKELATPAMRSKVDRTAQDRLEAYIERYDRFLKDGPRVFKTRDLDKLSEKDMLPVLEEYFADIKRTFVAYRKSHNQSGFKLGLYCTPLACLEGVKKEWAEYVWLSREGRFDPEYEEMKGKAGSWHMIQYPDSQSCTTWSDPGATIDLNQVNPKKGADIGQWKTPQ